MNFKNYRMIQLIFIFRGSQFFVCSTVSHFKSSDDLILSSATAAEPAAETAHNKYRRQQNTGLVIVTDPALPRFIGPLRVPSLNHHPTALNIFVVLPFL